MKKSLAQAVFIIPLLAIIAAPIFVEYQGKESAQGTKSTSDAYLSYRKSSTGAASKLNYPKTGDKYAMSEPFALKYISSGYGNPMFNPAMWMYPMTWMNPANYISLMNPMTWMNPANYMNMMNPMSYMNMMYPMMGMMNPMMGGGLGGNPQMGVPKNPPISIPNVMNPKQYEQWYNEQQEKLKQNN